MKYITKFWNRRCLSIWLSIALIMGMFFNVPIRVEAAVNKTVDQAMNWVYQQEGKQLGKPYEGQYQCVGLTYQYMLAIGITNPYPGNAGDYATTNAVPNGITRIKGAKPQKGDILVYTGGYGHVAIYESDYCVWHQNYNNKNYVSCERGNRYDQGLYSYQSYWGVWRPDFSSSSDTPITATFETYGTGGSRGSVSDTNATLYVVVYTNARSGITMGLRLGTSSGNWDIKTYEETLSNAGYSQLNSNGCFEAWFDCNKELGVSFSKGTTYWYQFYIKVNGIEYTDSEHTFTTTGTVADTQNPSASNLTITEVSKDGYRVTCNVSDNVGITRVSFPTWITGASTADVKWLEGTVNGNTATCYIMASDFTENSTEFTTDVYAYDAAGNVSEPIRGSVYIDRTKPIVSNTQLININRDSYTLSCHVSDNVGVTKVRFLTYPKVEPNNQKEIYTTNIVNGVATGTINIADFGNAGGQYCTDIYAYDAAGNQSDLTEDARYYPNIDRTPPAITDIQITDENEEGYTVSCKVEDDSSGVSTVSFLTLVPGSNEPEGWKIDAKYVGEKLNDRYYYTISLKDYDYEAGKYVTTICARDSLGNEATTQYTHEIRGDVREEDIPEDKIVPKGLWIAGVRNQSYTGKALKPAVRVYDGHRLLVEKRDYTISYKNNTKANDASDIRTAPTITVTGRGNYSGKDAVTFAITEKNISDMDITAENIAVKSNGKVQHVIPTLKWNGKKLSSKTDFDVLYIDEGDGVYRDPGNYTIIVTGKGNYTGSREVRLTVTSGKLTSNLSVAKIPNQMYTGNALTPKLTIKDGGIVLNENLDYTVSYLNNIEIGKATAVITGMGDYAGTKSVTFSIVGAGVLNKAIVVMTGEDGLSYTGDTYTGNEIRPAKYELSIQIKGDNNQTRMETLTEGKDYTVSYKNNVKAGTATIIFTGKGGYTGTVKKTYSIRPYDLGVGDESSAQQKVKTMLNASYDYSKGGCKPKPYVTFEGTVLKEGLDYTLTYRNYTKVNDGSKASKLPYVIIKGKGNFKGTRIKNYLITQKNLGDVTLIAADKVWENKANIYRTSVTVKDANGKKLSAGSDYDKKLIYTYQSDTVLSDGTVRIAGTEVSAKDIIPAGTIIKITAEAKQGSNYQGTVSGNYKITKADISKAIVKIPAQTYTGREITVDDVIDVRLNGSKLSENDYEVVSYANNVRKGTATVTIRGKNDCGGMKTVKFTIKSKGFLWWWRR